MGRVPPITCPENPGTFRVLTVCTGNICRSPAVERLLRAGLGAGVEIGSAGVRAMTGEPIQPPMAALLTAAGADPAGFAARQLTAPMAREAELVLALTRAHRGAVVELAPAALRRSFTLREFARLLAAVDPAALPPVEAGPAARLRAAVPLATALRAPATDPAADDVVDPYGGDDARYRLSFDQLLPAVRQIVATATGS